MELFKDRSIKVIKGHKKQQFVFFSSVKVAIIISIVIALVGCDERVAVKPSLDLCGVYHLESYADSLYSDTLIWVGDTSTINWYLVEIENVIDAVKANCQDSEHKIYPFHEFDQVTYYPLGFEFFGNDLCDAKIKELLELINNPLYYGWGETTFEMDQLIIFKNRGEEVARLEIMDKWIIKPYPDNVLMKAGGLGNEGRKILKKL